MANMLTMTSFLQARQRKMADRLQLQVNVFVLYCVYECTVCVQKPLENRNVLRNLIVHFYRISCHNHETLADDKMSFKIVNFKMKYVKYEKDIQNYFVLL